MTQEQLDKLNESSSDNLNSPINVSAIVSFGFGRNYISPDYNAPINKESFDICYKEDKHYDDFQVPVGYEIHNISYEKITDIYIPEYKYNGNNDYSNRYVGTLKKVNLDIQEKMFIPTEYLMILLIKLGKGPIVHNGKFVRIGSNCSGYNEKLRDYKFIATDATFKSYFESKQSCMYPIGAVNKNFSIKKVNVETDLFLPWEFEKTFGYLMNWKSQARTNTVNNSEPKKFFIKLKGE